MRHADERSGGNRFTSPWLRPGARFLSPVHSTRLQSTRSICRVGCSGGRTPKGRCDRAPAFGERPSRSAGYAQRSDTSRGMARVRFLCAEGTRSRAGVEIPGDKSLSHRALMLAAIADGATHIQGLSSCADVGRTIEALRTLGVSIEGMPPGEVIVRGRRYARSERPPRSRWSVETPERRCVCSPVSSPARIADSRWSVIPG